jgi:hypothetical protein
MFGLRNGKRKYQNGQITVSDTAVRNRLNFLGLTEEDLGIIAAWENVCRKSLDRMVDKFHEHIQANRDTRAILLKHSSVERQRPMLSRYVLTMFSGHISDDHDALKEF